MKFLEDPKLLSLTNTLNGADLGDRVVYGRIESYTCKSVKAEKVLSKEIEKQFVAEASTSPGGPNNTAMLMVDTNAASVGAGSAAAAPSPLGPLNSVATRKLLVNLITTMNASFPDYDFSGLRPEHFEYEANRFFVERSINSVLLTGMEYVQTNFRETVWKTIDEVIELDKCEIYSYSPDLDSDYGIGKLWSFNYFFFNKKKKNLVLFAAHAVSKMRGKNRFAAAEEDDMAADMDDANADAEPDTGLPLDWDDPAMNAKPATRSAFATPALAPANGRSQPVSPFFGSATVSASASAAPPITALSGQPQASPYPVPSAHPYAHSISGNSHNRSHSQSHSGSHAPSVNAMSSTPSASASASSSASSSTSTLLVMGPATPQQQLMMQQHHTQHTQQRTMSQTQPLRAQQIAVPNANANANAAAGGANSNALLARSLPSGSASIVGRPMTGGGGGGGSAASSAMQISAAVSPTEVLSKSGRTNSFAAAAALQQSMFAKQQIQQQRGSFSGSNGPSPNASPQIRPVQSQPQVQAQQPAGSPLVRPNGLQTGGRPTGVALPSSASNGAAAQQLQHAQQQLLFAQHHQRAAAAQHAAAARQANAIAFSQSMGIPLLKPITASNTAAPNVNANALGSKPPFAVPLSSSQPSSLAMQLSAPMSLTMPARPLGLVGTQPFHK